jgi:retinol dehydrogenase-12
MLTAVPAQRGDDHTDEPAHRGWVRPPVGHERDGPPPASPPARDLIPRAQGHWLLQELLIPALARAAASGPNGRARVVHTSSSGDYIGRIDYATLTPGAARTQTGAMGLYAQSKLGNFLVAREAARRHAGKGVLVNAVHPGGIRTELGRHGSPVRRWITVRAWIQRGGARAHAGGTQSKLFYPVPYGALTQLYVGTVPAAADANGKVREHAARPARCTTDRPASAQWFVPWAREGKFPNQISPKEDERLWAWLEAETATRGF